MEKARRDILIQKKNKKFYQKYKAKLDERLAHWQEIDETYDLIYSKYQQEMELYKRDLLSFEKNVSDWNEKAKLKKYPKI